MSLSSQSTNCTNQRNTKYYTHSLSALTAINNEVTTKVDQTITCLVGGLEPNKPAVSVVWLDPENNPVSSNDEYTVNQGTVDSTGTQSAELVISPTILSTLSSTSTYQCSVKSGKFPASPLSPSAALVVNVLDLGEFTSISLPSTL